MLSIMYVEHDDSVRCVVSMLLSHLGHEVIEVKRFADAAAALATSAVDIAIIDYHNSGMTGVELAQQITHDYPYIPVVITAGHPDDLNRLERERVPYPVLEKPFRLDALEQVLRDLRPMRYTELLST